MGYYSTSEKQDGKFRRIEVRVKRPGVRVQAREGYVAASKESSSVGESLAPGLDRELAELLKSPLPISDIPLRVVAVPNTTDGERARVTVVVEVGIRDFRFAPGDKLRDELKLAVLAYDRSGKLSANRGRRVNLALSEEAHELMLRDGLRVMTTLELPPGSYQVAVAARESGAGRTGLLYYDLAVPRCADGPSFGGLFLTSAEETRVPVMASAEERAALPFIPRRNGRSRRKRKSGWRRKFVPARRGKETLEEASWSRYGSGALPTERRSYERQKNGIS